MTEVERFTAQQFQLLDGVQDWRVLAVGVSAWFDSPSHAAGAVLVGRIADLTGSAGRLPDIDLRARGVQVQIRAGNPSGFTADNVATARAISESARELGLVADPSALQTVQLAIDALDASAVIPFWAGALGYDRRGEEDLDDPLRRDPGIWFQEQDEPRPLRNRIHLDVGRPREQLLAGLESVKSAGGREMFIGDYYATMADSEGNEVDLVPLQPGGDELDGGPETTDWRVLFGAMTFYPVVSPVAAADLAVAVADLADSAGLPLLIDLRPEGVTIDTGKDQWEDERFGELARQVQAAAHSLTLTADPTRLRFVQIGIDAVDVPAVRAFWRAVLGYQDDPRPHVTDIYDPRRVNMPLFFQSMSVSEQERREQRNRIHVDVFVPDDQAQARIDAAVAAGGRVVYDKSAPFGMTLADPEGNEVDIAVSVGREEHWSSAD